MIPSEILKRVFFPWFLLGVFQTRISKKKGCGSIPLRQLFGWNADMELPDLLHSLWIGCARDAIGSLLMDMAEFIGSFQHHDTWDERLQALTLDARQWCRQHKFPPSLVDDFSFLSFCK